MLETWPHIFGNTNHIVDYYLIEKPYIAANFGYLIEVSIQQTKSILDEIDPFLCENKLQDRYHIRLESSN